MNELNEQGGVGAVDSSGNELDVDSSGSASTTISSSTGNISSPVAALAFGCSWSAGVSMT